MKRRAWAAVVCVVLIIAAGHAVENEVVSSMHGFRVPSYTREGVLQSQLYGQRADFMADGSVRIADLRIDFYEEGEVVMRVTSPGCVYQQDRETVESDQAVRIEREGMVISGRGFAWRAEDELMRIRHDSRVEIESVRGRINEREGE